MNFWKCFYYYAGVGRSVSGIQEVWAVVRCSTQAEDTQKVQHKF